MIKLTVFNNLVDQKTFSGGSLTTHLTYMEKDSLTFVYILAILVSNETEVLTKYIVKCYLLVCPKLI